MMCNQFCPCNFSSFPNLDTSTQVQISTYYHNLNGPHLQLQTCDFFMSFFKDINYSRTVMDSLSAVEEYL